MRISTQHQGYQSGSYIKHRSNNHCSHSNHIINQTPDSKIPSASPSIPCDNSCKCHHHECSTRKGELVVNGGFENLQTPFFDWIINSGVDQIDPGMGDIAHQGLNASRLGFIEPFALIYQDIPGICSGRFYLLSFFLSTAKNTCNASVSVQLQFLDKYHNPMGNPVLDILIPQNSLYETYSAFIDATKCPAPQHAHFARVSFSIDTGADADDYVTLDDVSLVAIVGKVHV